MPSKGLAIRDAPMTNANRKITRRILPLDLDHDFVMPLPNRMA
jgi:hypothetical protein